MLRSLADSNDDHFGPDAIVAVEIGSIGIILFTILIITSTYAYRISVNKYAKGMFISGVIYSFLELPRYICLIIQKAYVSQLAYSFHLQGLKDILIIFLIIDNFCF